jgi:hypothetical protein
LRSFSPFSSSGSQKRCPELDLLQEVRRVSFRCIFFCSSDQRSSGLLTKIVAAVRALYVLEKAVAAAAVAPPDRVRPAWHRAACRRIPGYFAGIPGEFRVLPGIFLITAEKSPTTLTKE